MVIVNTADEVQCPENISHLSSPFGDTSASIASGGQVLLNALWRSPGRVHQIGELDRKTKGFKNTPVKNAVDALTRAKRRSADGIDAYLACAEYTTAQNRQSANVSGAWAFWLDIDCGAAKAANGTGYATCEASLQALTDFCKKAELPRPTHIVNSGSGLHVYWALVSVLPSEFWPTNAKKLKALTKNLGFLADDTRTADITSVLRVPGTLNFKYEPPRAVELVSASSEFIPTATMLRAIDVAYLRLCPVALDHHTFSSNDGESALATNQRTISKSVSAKNANLKLLRVVLSCLDADMGYFDWFRVCAGVSHESGGHEDGFELFDQWSSTGEKYRDSRETRSKWDSLSLDHPNPVTMATLRRMVEANGHDWSDVCAAEGGFDIINDSDCEVA